MFLNYYFVIKYIFMYNLNIYIIYIAAEPLQKKVLDSLKTAVTAIAGDNKQVYIYLYLIYAL